MKTRRMNNNVLEICDESNNVILSIAEEVKEDNTMFISLRGEIVNEVAHEFEDEVMAALSVCKKLKIILQTHINPPLKAFIKSFICTNIKSAAPSIMAALKKSTDNPTNTLI